MLQWVCAFLVLLLAAMIILWLFLNVFKKPAATDHTAGEHNTADLQAGNNENNTPAAVETSAEDSSGTQAQTSQAQTEPVTEKMTEPDTPAAAKSIPTLTGITSTSGILMLEDTGEVIAQLDPDRRIYPASMTKLMTALVVREQLGDMTIEITMPQHILDRMAEENASVSGLVGGETVTVLDMLYGILLPSGGDCCICMAEYISGSESEFAQLMNQKAAELGMNGSHFTNTTGLHEEDHYTTVRDMAILLRVVDQDPYLSSVITSERYSVEPTNMHYEGFTIFSTLFEYLDGRRPQSGSILGGKTGYTTEAGQCLASVLENGGVRYICVTAGAPGGLEGDHNNVLDAIAICNQYTG